MKTIGILGGMSCESTVEYYQLLNRLVRQRLGSLHSAKVIIHSLDFEGIAQLQKAGQWDELADVLSEAARQLAHADAKLLAIASNTVHCVAEKIQAAVDIPLLHIAEATGRAVQEAGLTRVGLLGTRFTMEGAFYREYLEERFGISVVVPNLAERDEVHRIIYEELCQGRMLTHSKQALLEIAKTLVSAGAEGIILGCTELPLILKDEDLPEIVLFDTLRLHVAMLVEESLLGLHGVVTA